MITSLPWCTLHTSIEKICFSLLCSWLEHWNNAHVASDHDGPLRQLLQVSPCTPRKKRHPKIAWSWVSSPNLHLLHIPCKIAWKENAFTFNSNPSPEAKEKVAKRADFGLVRFMCVSVIQAYYKKVNSAFTCQINPLIIFIFLKPDILFACQCDVNTLIICVCLTHMNSWTKSILVELM